MVSGRLNVVRSPKRTNQIVSFERIQRMIGLSIIPVRIYLVKDPSRQELIIAPMKKQALGVVNNPPSYLGLALERTKMTNAGFCAKS